MNATTVPRRMRLDESAARLVGALLDSRYAVRYFFSALTFIYYWALGHVAEGIASLHGVHLLIVGYVLTTALLQLFAVLSKSPDWVGRSVVLFEAPVIGLIVAHDPNPQVPLQLIWLIGALDNGMRFGLRGYLIAGAGFLLAAAFFLALRAAYFHAPTHPSAFWLLFLVVACYAYGLRLIAERDGASDRASDAERSIALTVEAIGIGIWRYDYRTGLLHWDANTERLAGLAPGSFSGRYGDFLRMLKSSDAERLQRLTAQAAFSGMPWEQEYEVIWRDGSEHLISSRGLIQCGDDGKPLQMSGVSWDITHMRRDYRAMVEANAYVVAAGKIAGVGYWSLQLSDNRVLADAQILRFHGFSADSKPRGFEDFIQRVVEEDRDMIATQLAQVIKQGVPFQVEYRVRRPDGDERVIRAAGATVQIPGEGADGRQLVGAALDVTRERRDQQQLRAAVERLRNFSEAARLGSWRYDPAQGLMQLDERLGALFGLPPMEKAYSAEQILGCVHPEDRAQVQAYFRALIENGESLSLEHRALWPDGSVRRMLARGVVERDERGVATVLRGVSMDISRLESALAEGEASS